VRCAEAEAAPTTASEDTRAKGRGLAVAGGGDGEEWGAGGAGVGGERRQKGVKEKGALTGGGKSPRTRGRAGSDVVATITRGSKRGRLRVAQRWQPVVVIFDAKGREKSGTRAPRLNCARGEAGVLALGGGRPERGQSARAPQPQRFCQDSMRASCD
jgi:hypothetical protein